MSRGPQGSLGDSLAAQADRLSHCVHCGFCLPACPTYVRLGDEADSPRGRLHLMGAVAEGRLDAGSDAFQRHIDRCLGCRACEPVCPSGVEYGLLLERAREAAARARKPPLAARLLLGLVARPRAFALWMRMSRLLRWTRLPTLLARILPGGRTTSGVRLALGMLAASISTGRFLRGAPPSGPGGTAERRSPPTRAPADAPPARSKGRAAILTGCVQDQLFRRVNAATRRVLEMNGWEVTEVGSQGCCGALHAHAGALPLATRLAKRNLEAFRREDPDRIVANAAGCGAAMRGYPHLVEGAGTEWAEVSGWFSRRVRDVTELLADEGATPVVGGELRLRVAYDPPCHLLHGQGVAEPPLTVLRSIPGVEVVELAGGEECCGGAGIYGLTHPELGGWIGGDKVAAVLDSKVDALVTGNPGCAMQIGAGLKMAGSSIRVVHPVEFLDESYRRAGFYDRRVRPTRGRRRSV